MTSIIGVDDVIIVDIHGVSVKGLPLVKWGLPLFVPNPLPKGLVLGSCLGAPRPRWG
jgi:hypothetical protein